jgi:hypothetical protein
MEIAREFVMSTIEDALTPAFIIEEHDDGRFTVFVPSIPRPLAGAVYILARERVHLLDVSFTQAIGISVGIRLERPRGRDAQLAACVAGAAYVSQRPFDRSPHLFEVSITNGIAVRSSGGRR